ncbi:MAG TPA: S41 family peptidase, partial [Chitinophagaceae bacterium]|nr:S41 family peptidase [Chitinophagaceae bacterium]
KDIKKELHREKDGTFTLLEEFNDELKIQQPKTNRFKGKVYFLIDGRSGSATAEFTAVAHSNHLGVFIGEETGGAYEGGNGGSFLHFELPHSKISIQSPLICYENAVHDPRVKGRGTIPDHDVPWKLNDALNAVDTQLEFVLDLISSKQ